MNPVSFRQFLKLYEEASIVYTDSGGVQEEAGYLVSGRKYIKIKINSFGSVFTFFLSSDAEASPKEKNKTILQN